jgi:phosphoribosyl-ATP pyrophosphohydrolase/phosphoribosyl-AMP cyclohydrolase
VSADIIARVEQVIAQRQREMPEGSYTAYLFREGQDKILKKLGEEVTETVIASKNQNPAEIAYEASDIVYHLLVLLRYHGMRWADIIAEMERRHGAA